MATLFWSAERHHRFVSGRNNVWRLRPDPPRGWVNGIRVIDIDHDRFCYVDEKTYETQKDVAWFVRAREILAIERVEPLTQVPWFLFHYVRLQDWITWGPKWRERPRVVSATPDWQDCRFGSLLIEKPDQ